MLNRKYGFFPVVCCTSPTERPGFRNSPLFESLGATLERLECCSFSGKIVYNHSPENGTHPRRHCITASGQDHNCFWLEFGLPGQAVLGSSLGKKSGDVLAQLLRKAIVRLGSRRARRDLTTLSVGGRAVSAEQISLKLRGSEHDLRYSFYQVIQTSA